MGAKYDTTHYDDAKDKYEQLAKKYEGIAGINQARAQRKEVILQKLLEKLL